MTPRDLLAEMFQVCHTGGGNPGHTGDPTIPPAPTEELEEAGSGRSLTASISAPSVYAKMSSRERMDGWIIPFRSSTSRSASNSITAQTWLGFKVPVNGDGDRVELP